MIPERTIGETIRLAREERGLSQEEISRETRLSLAVIRKLELDRFAELPGGLYTQNYIRILAEYLDLDGPMLLAGLRDGQAAATEGEGGPETWSVESVPETRVGSPRRPWRRWVILAALAALILLVLALWQGWLRLELGDDADSGPPPSERLLESSNPGTLTVGMSTLPEDPAPAADRGDETPAAEDLGAGLRREFHPPLAPPVTDSRRELLGSLRRSVPETELMELAVSADGPCVLHVNVDGERQLSRRFGVDGGLWTLYGADYFVLSAQEAGRLTLRFNGEAVDLPRLAEGQLMALRLDADTARQGP